MLAHLLKQSIAHSLDQAALDLPLDNQWIDRMADIVSGGQREDPDDAGFRVDLDLGALRREQEGPDGIAFAFGVEQCSLQTMGSKTDGLLAEGVDGLKRKLRNRDG